MSEYKLSQKRRLNMTKSLRAKEFVNKYGEDKYCSKCGRKMVASKDVYLYVCPGHQNIIPSVFVP